MSRLGDHNFINRAYEVMWRNISPAMGMDECDMDRLRELALDGIKFRKLQLAKSVGLVNVNERVNHLLK